MIWWAMAEIKRLMLNRAIAGALAHLPIGRRVVVAVAGIPGSGKSTLCESVAESWNKSAPGIARVVPMDGFHLPNAVLDARGLRKRKGSPESFDLAAFRALAERLGDSGESVVFPIYDRALHEPVLRDEPGQRIDTACRIVLVEGNYVLLDEPGWRDLAPLWSLKCFLNVPLEQARTDVIARHIRGGRTTESALANYEGNDLPNAQRILDHMVKPDLTLTR